MKMAGGHIVPPPLFLANYFNHPEIFYIFYNPNSIRDGATPIWNICAQMGIVPFRPHPSDVGVKFSYWLPVSKKISFYEIR